MLEHNYLACHLAHQHRDFINLIDYWLIHCFYICCM